MTRLRPCNWFTALLLFGLAQILAGPVQAGQLRTEAPVETSGWEFPLEQRLMAEGARGRIESFTLFEAALIASGVDDETELKAARGRIQTLVEQLGPKLDGASQCEAAATVFETLHKELLSGAYRPRCTSLRETFQRGDYNCVSSTILYCSLARACGLQVEAVSQPDHVYCRVTTEDEPLEIQTTCPTWFQRRAAARPRIPAGGAERTLGDVGLVALVYYNQGVELLVADKFPAAFHATSKAVRLDPQSTTAQANLRAAYNNWAVVLATSGNYEHALALLAEAQNVAPDHGPFRANELAIYQQWTASLVSSGQLRSALEILDRGLVALPDQPALVAARRRLYQRMLASDTQAVPGSFSADIIDDDTR